MSIAELIENYRQPTNDVAVKLSSLSSKRARRSAAASLRRQYYLTDALADLRQAMRLNEDIVISTLVIGIALGFAFAATASQFLLAFIRTAYAFSSMTGTSLALLTLLILGIMAAVGSWLFAFILNMFTIAAMEGANRKQYRSVRQTIRKGLANTTRVTNAWLLITIVATLPLGAAGILGVFYVRSIAHLSAPTPGLIVSSVAIAAAWILYVLATYGLVPQVALFEPNLYLTQTFGRSRQLVKRKGRLFQVSSTIVTASAIVIAYYASHAIKSVLHLDSGPVFVVMTLTILLIANGANAMLYRKRKMAKSR